MPRYNVKKLTYQEFISTVDHIWLRGKDEFWQNMAEEFEVSEITGEKLAYLCGLEDYVKAAYGRESTLGPHPTGVMEEPTYTEGLEILISVLGESKREDLLSRAIPEFMKYGVVVTSVFNAA